MQFVPIMVVGFAAALGLTPLSRQIAFRLGQVDKPTSRKIHHDYKPLMGGLAIYVAFALALVLFAPPEALVKFGAVLLGAAFLALIGFLDDRYTLSPRLRLLAMILPVVMIISAGIQIRLFRNPLIDYPLTVFWVLAIINAVNFLDNMDGLAAGLTAFAAAFFMVIALMEGLTLVSSLAAALLGSAVGFLVYNFNPANTFMGDMGALVLGFVLAVLGIMLRFNTPPGVTWMVPVLVLALPAFDINLVILTRLLEKRPLTQAGQDHTSHRLLSLGFSQRQTLFILYGACGLFGTIGLLVGAAPPDSAFWLGIVSLMVLGLLFLTMIFIRERFQKHS